jgi:hypothetical protein
MSEYLGQWYQQELAAETEGLPRIQKIFRDHGVELSPNDTRLMVYRLWNGSFGVSDSTYDELAAEMTPEMAADSLEDLKALRRRPSVNDGVFVAEYFDPNDPSWEDYIIELERRQGNPVTEVPGAREVPKPKVIKVVDVRQSLAETEFIDDLPDIGKTTPSIEVVQEITDQAATLLEDPPKPGKVLFDEEARTITLDPSQYTIKVDSRKIVDEVDRAASRAAKEATPSGVKLPNLADIGGNKAWLAATGVAIAGIVGLQFASARSHRQAPSKGKQREKTSTQALTHGVSLSRSVSGGGLRI